MKKPDSKQLSLATTSILGQPPSNSGRIKQLRRNALQIFQAGLAAADPSQAINRSLWCQGQTLAIHSTRAGENTIRRGHWKKVYLLAFGKAACAMADAARAIIAPELLSAHSLVVTNYENVTGIDNIKVIGARHPQPDAAGLAAAKLVVEQAQKVQNHELLLVLISGGGSALLPCPAAPVTLQDKIQTTGILLNQGATINQINCVRKHLSMLKGGGLARIASAADLHTLMLSDVLDDDVSTIASGPTVPDTTYFQDAISVFKNAGTWRQLPDSVQYRLKKGAQGVLPETPKPGDSLFKNTDYALIGSNQLSVNATMQTAGQLGFDTTLYNSKLCGEARLVAEKLVIHCKNLLTQGKLKPQALLAGGETTVTVRGNGSGGRNQEMALAFALAAEQHGLGNCWTFLSGGTDGIDGPTDAAGGVVDPFSLSRMRAGGLDPGKFLDNNASHAALKCSRDLLMTGATGTNVADLQVLLIQP